MKINYRYAVAVSVVIAAIFFAWQLFGPKSEPVTMMSQQRAETPQGIELAAKKAHISMLESQVEEASKEIAYLTNKPPDYIVRTVVKEIPGVVEKERVRSKADFAILTDPVHPARAVNLDDLKKLPDNTLILLNQYNVHAYKKIIRGVDIYPDWNRVLQGKPGIDEFSVDINRKISKDGKYIGVKAGYEFNDKEAKLGLRVMF